MLTIKNTSDNKVFYATPYSAGFDICANEYIYLSPGIAEVIRTGLFLEEYQDKDYYITCRSMRHIPVIPQLEIRARSSLAIHHGVTLVNGVGTVDADYPNEICVLLINHGQTQYKVRKGQRIAQGVVTLAIQIDGIEKKTDKRTGGFGSTGE